MQSRADSMSSSGDPETKTWTFGEASEPTLLAQQLCNVYTSKAFQSMFWRQHMTQLHSRHLCGGMGTRRRKSAVVKQRRQGCLSLLPQCRRCRLPCQLCICST